MKEDILYKTCGGVCSKQIAISLDGDVIESVRFTGGCQGNTSGICALVKGMSVQEAIRRLEGIDCRGIGTSCPDQLAQALKGYTGKTVVEDRSNIIFDETERSI